MNAWAVALESIWHHRLRSALTALGVVIGVFAFATLTSLGAGVRRHVGGQLHRLGADLIAVLPASPGAEGRLAGRRRSGGAFGGGFAPVASTLTVADADALALAVSLVVGAVAGVPVALRAARLQPAEALRRQ